MNDLANIITVKDLLTSNLEIPKYQRPYKWTEKNVNQLIDDILLHKDKSAYRLGTLVIHEDSSENSMNIVDGQQRTITLILIVSALKECNIFGNIEELSRFETNLVDLEFSNDISKANIQKNYRVIKRRIVEFDESTILFLFNKCQLVKIILTDISEAFQFFDSQNARGKDLEPHDLLKAFHLREMHNFSTKEERQEVVENWEAMNTSKLSKLFANYLYRIKNWSKGQSARYFSKNDVDIFKGINLEKLEKYPFAKLFSIAHYYTEDYNQSYHSRLNKCADYPFQLDQTIINGKRFFEMVAYYDELIDSINNYIKNSEINIINNYPGSYRTGDAYIRNLFYCGLIYYVDKFGKDEEALSKAINKIFIWAYTLRLQMPRVLLSSVDNYALNRHDYSQIQLFKEIRESIHPNDIINNKLKVLKQKNIARKEMTELIDIFKKIGYYEEEDEVL